jgi:hypothetical protein
MLTHATHVKLRRGILDFYFGNEQNRLGKEQDSSPNGLIKCIYFKTFHMTIRFFQFDTLIG